MTPSALGWDDELLLAPIDEGRQREFEALGQVYLAEVRSTDRLTRALSIASYEDGGLEQVFRAMCRMPVVANPALRAFRHFLLEHIRFDSDDGAGDIARALDHGGCLEVISGAPLPAGWTGKLWAQSQGIARAAERSPRYLLLTDADIAHAPDNLRRLVARAEAGGRSSAVLGATITAIELPTAFPYFAAITAIVSSGRDTARELSLLVLFNVSFVLPLLWIIMLLAVAGDRATTMLSRARDQLQSHWPAVLAGLALLAGVFVVLLGITRLAASSHP